MDKYIIDEKTIDFLSEIINEVTSTVLVTDLSFACDFSVEFTELNIHWEVSIINKNCFSIKSYEVITQKYLGSFKVNYLAVLYNFIFPKNMIKNHNAQKNEFEELMWFLYKGFVFFTYIMNNYKDYLTIRENPSVASLPTNRKQKRQKNKVITSRKVNIISKVIKLNLEKDLHEVMRKDNKHRWHVEQFTRRGHYRTYKNGNKVWIKAALVKTGANTGITVRKEFSL